MSSHFWEAETERTRICPIVTKQFYNFSIKVDELVTMELDPRRWLDSRIVDAIKCTLELIVSKHVKKLFANDKESLNQLILSDISQLISLWIEKHVWIGITYIWVWFIHFITLTEGKATVFQYWVNCFLEFLLYNCLQFLHIAILNVYAGALTCFCCTVYEELIGIFANTNGEYFCIWIFFAMISDKLNGLNRIFNGSVCQ